MRLNVSAGWGLLVDLSGDIGLMSGEDVSSEGSKECCLGFSSLQRTTNLELSDKGNPTV